MKLLVEVLEHNVNLIFWGGLSDMNNGGCIYAWYGINYNWFVTWGN